MNFFVGCFLPFFLAAVFLLKPLPAQQLMPLLSLKNFRFSRLFLLIFYAPAVLSAQFFNCFFCA
jgi:hypothetical protein